MINIFRFTLTVTAGVLVTACTSIAMPTTYQQDALADHNQLRKQHGAPAMQWDAALARYAAQHAARCRFQHSHGRYGENIAAGFPTSAAAIQAWYGENKLYSYQHPGFATSTGHFTQMVWKSTTKLGCASANCDGVNGMSGDFLVCEYSPAGNIINRGYFQRNVLPKSSASA